MMSTDKQYPGRIGIVRPRGDTGEDFIQIRIEDEGSGCMVIDIQMTVEHFGYAITGVGNIPCRFQLLGVEQVGKRVERKDVKVLVPDGGWATHGERVRNAIAVHEENGWEGYDKDAQNRHKLLERGYRGAWYRVGYTRFVEDEQEEGGE